MLQSVCHVVGHGANHFAFHFHNTADIHCVIEDVHYAIEGAFLALQQWIPDMVLSEFEITATPVWIRMLDMPLEYLYTPYITKLEQNVGILWLLI